MINFLLTPWKNNRKEMQTNHVLYGNLIQPLPIEYNNNLKLYREPDIRSIIHRNPNTIDLGCGIGISTPPGGIGIDENEEILAIARRMYPFKYFFRGDLEDWGDDNMIETVVCSFVLSTKPEQERRMIMENGYRICNNNFMILDYDPDNSLENNKYMNNYKENINKEIYNSFSEFFRLDIISQNIVLWNITKYN